MKLYLIKNFAVYETAHISIEKVVEIAKFNKRHFEKINFFGEYPIIKKNKEVFIVTQNFEFVKFGKTKRKSKALQAFATEEEANEYRDIQTSKVDGKLIVEKLQLDTKY